MMKMIRKEFEQKHIKRLLPDRRPIGGVNARSMEVDWPLPFLFHLKKTIHIPEKIKMSMNEERIIIAAMRELDLEFLLAGTKAVNGF